MFALTLLLAGCRADFKPVDDTGALGSTDDTDQPLADSSASDDTSAPGDSSPPEDSGDSGDGGDSGDSGDSGEVEDPDSDGDGYPASVDCDDSNSEIHPDADEVCDGVDNDCDLLIDSDDESVLDAGTWYADLDADGFGDEDTTAEACDQPKSYTDDATDCDDSNAAINPDATEICNEIDDDCDGLIDDDDPDVADATTWYLDADSDGVGGSAYSVTACDPGAGFAETTGDCDDDDATIQPGANEVCDGEDNDCDSVIDEAGAEGESTWYADADGDGWGDADDSTSSCDGATGYVADATDCDDGDASVNPAADEICNEIDDDCDTLIDDDDEVTDASTWYVDDDGDGYGDASTEACDQPSGTATDDGDCDDADAEVNPGATEICNGIDDDCDGLVDDDDADLADATTWYLDYDGDGFGNEDYATSSCDTPDGYVSDATDCDDTSTGTNPDADEVCDEDDNDCDDSVDEGATDAVTWYADDDDDGFGDDDDTVSSCDAPSGYVEDGGDCDDADSDVSPDADEICNELDDDCDGLVDDDDDVSDPSTWYTDDDGDGFGDAATEACDQPSGTVSDDGDCDDGDAAVNPDADEICNELDDDCDGLIDDDDDDLTDGVTSYMDYDGDGYGAAEYATSSCDTPDGYVSDDTDCDDTSDATHPDADEACNGEDDDCDGTVDEDAIDPDTWYEDGDGDGYGSSASSTESCDEPSGYVSNSDDCDDTDATLSPDTEWYIDYDGDGYGSDAYTTEACEQPSGYVGNSDDCDDADASIADLSWYEDLDCDGYGDDSTAVSSCEEPSGMVATGGDCDDDDPLFHPSAAELCNSDDNDCDSTVDEDCQEPIELGSPSEVDPGTPTTAAACAWIGETTNTSYNTHDSADLDTFMGMLDGSVSGLTESVLVDAEILDWSARCGSDYTASEGNYGSTEPWPTLTSQGSYGMARFRGYLRIGCEDELNRTIGLIGNDSLSLTIEGTDIATVNWNDGQWKKFRYVSFPEPGLYAFEVKWSTNLICSIDPFELVWAEGFVDGYDEYDTMCASSSCDYDGVEIPGFTVIEGDNLAQASDGGETDCAQCDADADCDTGASCNSAGVCE